MQNTTHLPIYRINDLWCFNPNELTVQSTEQCISLRKKNNDVLHTLVENHGTTVTTAALYEAVWGKKCVSEGVIKRSICDLRNILSDHDKQIIITVPKQGYRLQARVECIDVAAQIIAPKQKQSLGERQTKRPEKRQPGLSLKWHSIVLFCCTVLAFLLLGSRWLSASPNHIPYNKDYSSALFIYEVMELTDKRGDNQQLLANLKQKFNTLQQSHPEREGLARQLIAAYIHAERFDEASALCERILIDTEKQYGAHDIKTVKTREFLFDALLKAKQIQSAYAIAKRTMEIVRLYHQDNTTLLAFAHLQSAQANLSCVYPYCDRQESLIAGKEHAEQALNRFAAIRQDKPIAFADAQLLKNWFSEYREEKLQLVSSALQIYLQHLGQYDDRTAAAYSQLGKIERHWSNNYPQSERYLTQALNILQSIYGDNYEAVKDLRFELAWLYLEQEHFDKAIQFADMPLAIDCRQPSCLKGLQLLIKAHFYRGNIEQAKQLASQLSPVINNKDIRLPFSLLSELKALHMRVFNAGRSTSTMALSAIEQQIAREAALLPNAKNAHAIYNVIQEYQQDILQHFPQALNVDKYLYFMDLMLLSGYSSYMTQADKNYLYKRAMATCGNHSKQLCRELKLQSQNQFADIGPWSKR